MTLPPRAAPPTPPPTALDLSRVPGVLGQIVRERQQDYAGTDPGLGPSRPAHGRFRAALASDTLALIAEVKRASPSQGQIAALDPAQAARDYQSGGAAALSVLTEPRHFGGDRAALESVLRAVPGLPALRKDFVIHPALLREAAEWGASAALLMVNVLGAALPDYLAAARWLGLDALVEVHDAAELDLALAAGADLIGVNNRDLRSLQIDLTNAPRLIRQARAQGYTGLLVAESGYCSAADLRPLRGLADAVLVGSSLAGSGDLARAARDLLA